MAKLGLVLTSNGVVALVVEGVVSAAISAAFFM
jgi:hypothetical protein